MPRSGTLQRSIPLTFTRPVAASDTRSAVAAGMLDWIISSRGVYLEMSHQVMCEEGYVIPGTMVVASDSHSNMYGGLGALGTPLVRTDAAAIWATGMTWWQVPPVAKGTIARHAGHAWGV